MKGTTMLYQFSILYDGNNRLSVKLWTFSPLNVDMVVQVQSVNDVSLNGEYVDATIAVSMVWSDYRLQVSHNSKPKSSDF